MKGKILATLLAVATTSILSAAAPPSANTVSRPHEYYVLIDQEGYAEAGGGWARVAAGGFGAKSQRKSCQPGAIASFTPRLAQGGRYRIIFWSGDADEDRTLRAVIKSEKTVQRPVVLAAGRGQWVDLGIYDFRQGTIGSLSIQGSGRGCVRASAAKFVRAA
ncbi:hypothetical protein [Sphingomonas sp.]|uniref:golvesin C-terminal-like domain-containing protein n=1 Tax=Sphingomonas sp. TaxID=28214 RepID=UPI003B3ABEAC